MTGPVNCKSRTLYKVESCDSFYFEISLFESVIIIKHKDPINDDPFNISVFFETQGSPVPRSFSKAIVMLPEWWPRRWLRWCSP